MTLRSLRLFMFTGLTACVLGAVACGGDDDDDIVPGSSSGSTADSGTTSSSSSSSGATSSSSSSGDANAPKDLVDTAVAAGTFNTLAELLTLADLVDTLKDAGPFTVLAPTDAAFAKLDAATVAALKAPANKALLQRILTYHVLGGSVPAATVVTLDGKKVSPLEGENLGIEIEGSSPTLVNNAGELLATVTATDITATNGIIHVIDTVLVPPTALVALDPDGKDLVEAAEAAGFTALADALGDADLVATLQGPGPFTVFAPTNAAFSAAGTTLATLTDAQVKNALLFHVSDGITGSAKVLASASIVSKFGTAPISVQPADLTLNGAAELDASALDIPCKNGIIHVLDDVMVPAGL